MGARGRKAAGVTLATLDPVAVAQEAAELLARRVVRHGSLVSPALQVTGSGAVEWGATTIGPLIYDLAHYAQSGGDHALAYEGLITACDALLSRPIDDGDDYPEPADHDTRPVSLVLLAARARWQISEGAPITAAALAALCSITPGNLRLIAAGTPTIGTRPVRYAADRCRELLAERRVPGF